MLNGTLVVKLIVTRRRKADIAVYLDPELCLTSAENLCAGLDEPGLLAYLYVFNPMCAATGEDCWMWLERAGL